MTLLPRRSGLKRSPMPKVSKKRQRQAGARQRCLAVCKTRANGLCEMRTPVCLGRWRREAEDAARAYDAAATKHFGVFARTNF